jgi:NADH-ubiquinone oxidoreductase chain 5
MINKNFPLYAIKFIWLIIAIILIPSIYCLKLDSRILLEWTLLSSIAAPVNITLIIDSTRMLYSTVVILISANVLSFSTVYIREDKFINRFTILVLAFIISINFLIYIPHLIILLLGWDGLGITSFVLVIYYQNSKSLRAGLVTAMTNRIGDVAILLSIAWTLSQGHWNIIHIRTENVNIALQVSIITLAAITKSAQIPFSRWLPAAMAAPTPVSALVHSSTLVTAGVFLLIRFYPFIRSLYLFNEFMLFIAVSTIIIAGIRATTECDIKKIIALSTLSQLGIIITRIGLGFPQLAFIHIVIHALFKALLFICAGNIIRVHRHAQDLRWMGRALASIPVTSTCIITANLALCGFPFMSGFYSKDIIVEIAIFSEQNIFIVILILVSVGYTSFYSIRFLVITLWRPRLHKPHSSSTESPIVVKPMVLMSILSVISGSLIIWMIPNIDTRCRLPLWIKTMPTLIILFGVIIGWRSSMYRTKERKYISINFSHYASCSIWFLVPLSTQFVIEQPIKIGHRYLKLVDQAWFEKISGQGMLSRIMTASSSIIKNSPQTPNSYLLIRVVLSIFTIPIVIIIYCMWCKLTR